VSRITFMHLNVARVAGEFGVVIRHTRMSQCFRKRLFLRTSSTQSRSVIDCLCLRCSAMRISSKERRRNAWLYSVSDGLRWLTMVSV